MLFPLLWYKALDILEQKDYNSRFFRPGHLIGPFLT